MLIMAVELSHGADYTLTMAKPGLVLFDFDGTIADSLAHTVRILKSLAAKYGLAEMDEARVKSFRSQGLREIVKALGIPAWKLPLMGREAQVALQQEIKSIPAIAGMKEVIAELSRRGFRVGILSSNSRVNVEVFLAEKGVEGIDFVVGGVSIFGKAGRILAVVKKEKISRDRVVYIGDEVRDIEAALKAGVNSIAVTWGFNTKERLLLAEPTKIVSKPAELVEAIGLLTAL
jgi:phosphoglycolate phosphatase